MAETWPANVPTDVMQDGYTETLPDNVLRSSMDAGPDKMRQRSTSAPRPMTWKIHMTTAQVALFDTWFTGTVDYGALSFNFTWPRTGVSDEMRFTAPPTYQSMGAGQWDVFMRIEVLP